MIKAHPAVSIKAKVNGVELPRRSFAKAVASQYVETVPESAFTKQPAEVEFEVDQTIPLLKYGNAEGSLMVYSIALSHPIGTLFNREQEIVRARQGYQYLLAKRDLVVPANEQTRLMRLFHEVPVWQHMFFHNVAIEKNPLDLWMVQQVIYEVQPDLVIETGTWLGGSALYYAHTLNGMGLEGSRVVTIDIQNACATAQTHPLWKKYVTFLQGSSTDGDIVAHVTKMAKGKKTFVTLDSDHSMAHVLKELEAYAPLVSRGSYLIVEDTNLDGVPIAPEFPPGPMAAVRRSLEQSGGQMFEQDETREAYLITFNPGGWLRRK
jgi:cephalosporin hydroxylase